MSVDDGWRTVPLGRSPTREGHTIWIAANLRFPSSEGNHIDNSTICLNKDSPTSIIIEGQETCIYNNIFYSSGGGMIGGVDVIVRNLPTLLFISNNLFYGKIPKRSERLDRDPVNGNREFAGSGAAPYGYQLRATSPAVNRGVKKCGPAIQGGGTGIFKDVPAYLAEDFYSNPVDFSSETPDIGACNAKRGQLATARCPDR